MKNSKHGLRVPVIAAVAALGALAFGATGAPAQLPGESKAGSFSANLKIPTGHVFFGEQLGSSYLLVAARDVKIECKTAQFSGVINNATDAEVEVTFEGCVATNHAGTPLKGCQFKELETIKASALALPIVHGGERFVLFEPLSGDVLAIISFKPELLCTLPLNNPVTGFVAAKTSTLEGAVLGLTFSEANQLLSGDVLRYGALANTSYLNGTAHVELDGFNVKLGVH